VYFDPARNVYFVQTQGRWQAVRQLPANVQADPRASVQIDLEGDEPFRHHDEVLRRYPPGQEKKTDDANDGDNEKRRRKGRD
jgi:hypothetical protein